MVYIFVGFGMGTKLAIFHMCGIMLLLRAVINMGVVIFTLLYCLLGLSCGEFNVISLYFLCCSVNGSVCLVYLVLFGETIGNIVGCGCHFVVECYVSVDCCLSEVISSLRSLRAGSHMFALLM